MLPFREVLKTLDLEASVACHIEYLIKDLYIIDPVNNNNQTTFNNIGFYISVFTQMVPSTPSAVFSPSGLIFTCNQSFSTLVHTPLETLLSGSFCIFSLLDLPSILNLLDMSIRFKYSNMNSFGRVSVSNVGGKRLCACSVSTEVDGDCLWIVAQFIPI
jgi:hypothetical protein